MSLSSFDSFQSRFVTYLLNRPRIKELKDLYCSPNIFRVIKSRRIRWAGHVAHMQERKGVYRALAGKSGKHDFEDQGANREIILKWFFMM